MKDLIRISIADAAERARIGESALQRVIGRCKRRGKAGEPGFEDVDAAGIECAQALFAATPRAAKLVSAIRPR